ncbi:hypothetical protein [Belnapia moabensis]|uniref:hypothetical protein n=1 Tax=Belnapia moabensis TaxID=365533 RepID=UPI0012ED6B6E|nr:hypothetical protein [Belnapia moabensis]
MSTDEVPEGIAAPPSLPPASPPLGRIPMSLDQVGDGIGLLHPQRPLLGFGLQARSAAVFSDLF